MNGRRMNGRRLVSTLVATAILAVFPAGPAAAWEWPPWVDGLLFNAAERTEAGRRALEAGEVDAALGRFESAHRLAPDDPVAGYNAGTARLAAARSDAASLLEAAARSEAPAVAAKASYNLGNARFGANDFAGAVEAYRDALRSDPGYADAKHNLELALRKLQEQSGQQGQPQPQDQQQQDRQQQSDEKQESQSKDSENPENKDQKEESQSQPKPGDEKQDPDPKQEEPPEQGGEKPQDGAQPPPKESPLPQFKDLPEMTAEEAAAILQAVENLERDQRRKEALEAMKKSVKGKKDW